MAAGARHDILPVWPGAYDGTGRARYGKPGEEYIGYTDELKRAEFGLRSTSPGTRTRPGLW